MKRALLIAALLATSGVVCGQTFSGVSINAPTVGGGGGGGTSTNISVEFDCRSFGKTANATESAPGTLNIKYATPVMCWATSTTVSGTAVNGGGWVPEVWFDWDWDDSSLGTVSRGGLTVDLGKSIGLVAAHAFKPSTYAETCGGGTNSSHTVTLTVYALVSGARESDSATMTVCVENPATTWPTPIAYCDDADCSNDTFSNVVNPGTPSHGGNGTALNTILAQCASSSNRILVEGGVTFSTGSTTSVGANRCLVESYGTGNAVLKYTASTNSNFISATHANCAGYVLNDVTFANTGGTSAAKIIGGSANTGCYALIDSDVSTTAGEEWGSIGVIDPTGVATQQEAYFIRFTFDRMANSGWQGFYAFTDYTAFVGSEVSGVNSGTQNEHNIRLPQWHYFVLDATKLADQQFSGSAAAAKSLITLRMDCGGTTSCPNNTDASVWAMTRNEFVAHPSGTDPYEYCTSGAGSSEQTKCYDGDFLRNIALYESGPTTNQQFVNFQGGGSAGNQMQRTRVFQNAFDATPLNSSTAARFFTLAGSVDDIAYLGNVMAKSGTNSRNLILSNGSTSIDAAKNNGCFETGGTSTCDMFPGIVESADNVESEGTDPFNGASGDPGQFTAFTWDDLDITTGSAFKDAGVITAYPTDVVDGGTCASAYDVGVDCE